MRESLPTRLSSASMLKISCVLILLASSAPCIVNALTAHLVPHTHDDAGWLKTVDEYYLGLDPLSSYGDRIEVRKIITSVVDALSKDPARKFVYVEQVFFQMWWNEQSGETRDLVRQLVKGGQLHFANGGWVMHDEACTHFVSMVDQTTLGHRFLLSEFGYVPRAGVGFDSLFFARIDYEDRRLRKASRAMEFVWQASPSLGPRSRVWTSVLDPDYGPLAGFCFDELLRCPLQQDIHDDEFWNNTQARVDEFVARVQEKAAAYQGDDVMLPMGSDFMYQDAHRWYRNLDRLIAAVNSDGRVHARYSTPDEYAAAKLAANLTWPMKFDDFFPYSSNEHEVWSGYFTSRPSLKRNIREHEGYLQAARVLDFLQGGNGSSTEALWRSVALLQHHDAVTGTSKQHVAYDYAQHLSRGRIAADVQSNEAVNRMSGFGDWHQCPMKNNASQCDISVSATSSSGSSSGFQISVFNPNGWDVDEPVALPVSRAALVVRSSSNTIIPSTVLPVDPARSHQIVQNRESASVPDYTLHFNAAVPAFGFSFFAVNSVGVDEERHVAAPTAGTEPKSLNDSVVEDFLVVGNEYLTLSFSSETKLLSSITDVRRNVTLSCSQQLMYYEAEGHLLIDMKHKNSGAYVFLPRNNSPIAFEGIPSVVVAGSPGGVQEVRLQFASWAGITYRLQPGMAHVDMIHTVGPVDVSNGIGKEVVARLLCDIASAATMFTDSNGREMMRRMRNSVPTWNMSAHDPVPVNYYPVTSAAYIQDDSNRITLLPDRTMGMASLTDGAIEYMVHRRLLHDDKFGVTEPLDETQAVTWDMLPLRVGPGLVVSGSVRLLIGDNTDDIPMRRHMSTLFGPPLLMMSHSTNDTILGARSFLAHELPQNVAIMTFQPIDDDHLLLRLAHLHAVGETLGQPVNLSLPDLFLPEFLSFSEANEVSLTANQPATSEYRSSLWRTSVTDNENLILSQVASPPS